MATTSPITVLVVEDDALIRMEAVDIVEEAGFHAIEAANADEAIRFLETDSSIRIIFTDIDMPGSMDGLKLAHAVRARWPPVVILAASGQQKPKASDLPTMTSFFSKPYIRTRITAALREAARSPA